MKRREFLKLSLGATAAASLSPEVRAQASLKEIRIGYQKTGVLVIARQQAVLEKRFAGKQIGIKWIEFTSGPPLLEAMSIGSVDLGSVGDTPPIFAQAANANDRLRRGIADHQRAGHSRSRQLRRFAASPT